LKDIKNSLHFVIVWGDAHFLFAVNRIIPNRKEWMNIKHRKNAQ
jgi:hypothetical protein